MANTQVQLGQKLQLTIKRLGINGEGIGYYKKLIIFVPRVLPGEQVIAEVTKASPHHPAGFTGGAGAANCRT